MRLAIMQPYLFPYIGYFQLLEATDKFVFYDDVSFIKQGWVNRNQIQVGGKANMFTVPVQNISSFTSIRETRIDNRQYALWRKKFLRTLEQNYRKAPFFIPAFELVQRVLEGSYDSISALCKASILTVSEYLKISTTFVQNPDQYENAQLKSQERILDICRQEQASVYINAIGGSSLYSKEDFSREGIKLQFIKPVNIFYPQHGNDFVPFLSIIDVIMYNKPSEVKVLLANYELV